MAQSTYKRIEAVKKTLEIIDYLGHQKEPVTGVDIAKAVSLQAGTVMCHLATLEDGGFVQQVGGAYRLGMKLAVLWARKKAALETEISKKQEDLNSITV